MMSEPMLVVDFGTSTSSAALVVGDSVRLVKEPASGSWSWPSSVCLDGENLLVGTAAERLRRVDPLVYRAEFKRDLGDPVPIVLGDKSFRPEELVTEFIAALRQQAQRLCNQQLHRLVLTVPASYAVADTRRDLMIDAGTAAGFAEVELLTEPVAAAFAPVEGAPIRPGDLVLVYDLGGGTFDAALVRTGQDDHHEVLGHGSLEDVGGRDIDAMLFAHVRKLGGDKLVAQLDTPVENAVTDEPRRLAAHRMRTELADFVRQLKHQLSDASTARDFFSLAELTVLVDRSELTTMVSPPLRRTVRCCAEVLASAGVEPAELTAVQLVGGSTRMPVVAETVAAELGVPLRFAEDPSTAVVHGAANWVQRAGLRCAELRVVGPWSCEDGEFPVRWRLPGDTGTIVRWLVEPGDQFDADEPLAVVRVVDGALWRLFASDHPGVLVSRHASVGDRIVSGQWLVTIGSAAPGMKSSSPGSQAATPSVAAPIAGRTSIRSEGFRRDVAAVKPQIKPLVKKKIPDLAQAMGEAVAKDMTERHVIPAFQAWRNSEIDTVADMVRLVVEGVKADLSASNNAKIPAVTAEWQYKVRAELDSITWLVCNRWHIEPGALRLPPITVRTGNDIKVTIDPSTPTNNLDNAADPVNVIVAGIVATTLSGAGASLIAVTGPFAIINHGILTVGKDKVMGKLQTIKTRGWKRKLIGEPQMLNRLRWNAPKSEADLAAELSKEFTKECEKSVVEQVTADISAQLDAVVDEAELLIK